MMGNTSALNRVPQTASTHDSWPEWFESEPRWLTAQRVVASRHFVRSRLLAKFLLYIVAETLEDRTANITEHRIGVQVFDRPQSYSSIQDNIVRTYARQLRRRLTEYFADEGQSEPIHIDIPLGAYIPVFKPAQTEASTQEKEPAALPIEVREARPDPPESLPFARKSLRWRNPLLTASALVLYSCLLFCLAWFAAARSKASLGISNPADPASPLWAALFGGPANCYIVPADAGFNILEDLSGRPLPLVDYMKGSYLTLPLGQIDNHSADDLRGQQFTSFTDLQIVAALAHLPQFNPQRAILRFPRDLQLDDIKEANAIILGSMGSNPWAAIAEGNANFRIVNGATMQGAEITNAHPQPGEIASYASQWSAPAHETYAVIAYLPNLGGNGHILLLQGLDVAGTQAAAEALFNPSVIGAILSRATRRDGTLRSFEILLRSKSLESKSAGAEVVVSRVY
jgi:hypothetical protein